MRQRDTSVPPLRQVLEDLRSKLKALQPAVDRHITRERLVRYLKAIADTPAPSTAASAIRGPVLRELLRQDGALDARLTLDTNFANTAGTVILTGDRLADKPLWYFAHLDTISYLVRPVEGERYPLIPFCYHLITDGLREARCYRFDIATARYVVAAEGQLESQSGEPFFRPADPATPIMPGDRVVLATRSAPESDGNWTGHFDNAGGVAALAVAAPVLAAAGFEAMLAFPDEEEGPTGSGNQIIGRGGSRIIDRLAPPDLAVVVDMQQAEYGPKSEAGVRLGRGAVLSEFSSLARGAVTPPHLLAIARELVRLLDDRGVKVQEAFNSYTSRSDDVSVMLKTPNILLLGFPGLDRHFDTRLPTANPDDIVELSKALVYMALLHPTIRSFADSLGDDT
jgi:putative aminopeptidase FrvX